MQVDGRHRVRVGNGIVQARRTAQCANGTAVVGQVVEVLLVRSPFDAGGDLQTVAELELILDVGLNGRGGVGFAEIGHCRIDPGARVSWNLVAVAIGLFSPQTSAQGARTQVLADAQQVANGGVGVELVNGAGCIDGRGAVVVVLFVPITVGVDLVFELPAAIERGGDAAIDKVCGDVVEVEAIVVGLGRVGAEQRGEVTNIK